MKKLKSLLKIFVLNLTLVGCAMPNVYDFSTESETSDEPNDLRYEDGGLCNCDLNEEFQKISDEQKPTLIRKFKNFITKHPVLVSAITLTTLAAIFLTVYRFKSGSKKGSQGNNGNQNQDPNGQKPNDQNNGNLNPQQNKPQDQQPQPQQPKPQVNQPQVQQNQQQPVVQNPSGNIPKAPDISKFINQQQPSTSTQGQKQPAKTKVENKKPEVVTPVSPNSPLANLAAVNNQVKNQDIDPKTNPAANSLPKKLHMDKRSSQKNPNQNLPKDNAVFDTGTRQSVLERIAQLGSDIIKAEQVLNNKKSLGATSDQEQKNLLREIDDLNEILKNKRKEQTDLVKYHDDSKNWPDKQQ